MVRVGIGDRKPKSFNPAFKEKGTSIFFTTTEGKADEARSIKELEKHTYYVSKLLHEAYIQKAFHENKNISLLVRQALEQYIDEKYIKMAEEKLTSM